MGSGTVSNPPPGFQLDAPPDGFRIDNPAPRGKLKLDPPAPQLDARDIGTTYTATGQVVDGDTIKVNPYLSARLSGFDAFEKGQPGYRPGTGQRLDLGALATSALTPYIRPSQPAYGTGAFTYGRPVVTLGQGQNDPIPSLLQQGSGYAAPEYLSADPERAASYMEAERLGRLNRQGGFGANHIRPDAYRRPLTERTAKLAPDEYLAFDDQLPADAPKLKRLTADQEKRNAAYIASNVGNPNFNLPEYQRWFREELGVTDVQPTSAEYVDAVRKGGKIDYGINYSALDAESQQELKELIAFSGMRPEVAQTYRDLLNEGDTAGALAYGKKNGMDFDPADIQRYIDARKKGENGQIPLPLINPGEGLYGIGGNGAGGAYSRGFADPVNILDEGGAYVDALAPAWMQRAFGGPEYRENVWNSDRGYLDIVGNNARQNRGIIAFDEKYHPYARTAGQLTSGIILPYGAGARGALNLAKIGAVEGGIASFGGADGSFTDRLKAVPVGATIGGIAGGALGKGAELAAPLLARGAQRLIGRPRAANDMAAATGEAVVPPAGFQLNVPARPIDRLDIPPSNNPLPLPALGERVPSANPGPVVGKPPTLSEVLPKIQDWAKSQAPGTMFHGSPRAGITEFDPYGRADYGLFGQGTYLTDNPSVAAGYTAKGMKAAGGPEGRTIYGVEQNVTNPLDMDAPADLGMWEKAAGQYTDQFRPGMTNAEAFREVEDAIRQEGLPKWEGAEMMNDVIRGMGHDGVTHIGGGRYGRGDGPRHKVVIALDPEQTKITNSLSLGDMMRAPQRERDWIDIQAQDAPPQGFVLDAPQARADMGAEAMPSLSSPRLPDVIDVNANRTTRLLDGPTDAMMRAATARVQPGDLLPRPANEVQSLDEFGRISEGLYPEVRAPNERDLLAPRQFPSRSNPDNMLNRKGPLDLAAYVRSQGGVADFRGELKAAGLSNAPRKGDDFAGGENRLGPLLDDESGSTLDDMAQRAWEAGYFPDHATRPTIDEFVTALGDTYRGVNRTFRPDDFAEIDAFNAARDQRLAVERSRQEGAPLAEDMGQPVTLDDVIANTPPATAYDDWNNAVVSKVGNIRVDKLDTPQDIGQALKVADNVAGGFDAAKRGKISFAETQALAQDLGMTADDLLARRKGQAFSAEEAYAARAILAKSGNELVNLAKRVQSLGAEPGSEALAAFRKALVRHTAIQEQVSGATAEAGRALSAFRMTADSRDIPGRVLEGLVNSGGGPGRLIDAADAIVDLARDPANLNQFVEKVSKPTLKDKAVELWYNFLLSGPQTHAVNMLSNTMTSISQIPEFAVAAGVGATRRALRREAADRVLLGEVGARAVGLLQGAKEGARMFATALRTGEASDFITKVENQGQKAISGLKGEVVRLPSRFLTAEDEMFKGIARRMELNGLAIRKASKEGFKGQEARDRAAELLANPTDDMLLSALEYGRYATFQAPLGRFASKVSAATTEMPILKAVLPFVRTPTNLFKFFVERTPAAPLLKEFRRDFAAGGAKRDLAIAKVMVGSGMGAAVAELAAKGIITGSPPKDDNKRGLQMADGWQPYSVKIGDQYYSYKRLDPFSLTIGAAADLATLSDGMTDKQLDNQAGLVTASILGNLSNKTWLSGVSDLLSAADDPERFGSAFIKRLAGSVTVPTGVAQIARTMDPTARETPDITSAIQARIPGLSDNLLPKRDVWGRPIVNDGGVGPDILSPIWTSTDRKDPITLEALRVGAPISKPDKGDMTPEQYDQLQPVAGGLARKWIGELMASPEYQAMPKEDQAEEIRSAITAARKEAKAHVLGGEPLDDVRPEKKRRNAKPTGLPEGFVIDPLPTGFVLDQ